MISPIQFREAKRSDVPEIIRMLADDELGSQRENFTSPLSESYWMAFDAIDRDVNNELIVAEYQGSVVGALQITFIPCLTYRGSWRALIEGVRVDRSMRSMGIGRKLILWAIDRAKQRDCHLVQLASDKQRPEAIRFYVKIGFMPTHEGLKLHIANHG